MEFKKYGKIENLSRRSDVLDHECVVTEKIHGTNMRAMWDHDHGLVLGGRNHIFYQDGARVDGLSDYGFTDYMLALGERHLDVYDRHIFYGEWYGPGVQKGVRYSKEKQFRVFDVRGPSGDYLPFDRFEDICLASGFLTVPLLYAGKITIVKLDEMLDDRSTVGLINGFADADNTQEGVVIKPATPVRDHRGNWVRAKYKSNKWAENDAGATQTRRADPERAAVRERAVAFAPMVVTRGRVATIAEHITRDGNSELNMGRTPDFIRAMISDVMEEHNDIYEGLGKEQRNAYNKAISGLAVKMWKEYLFEQ